MKDREIFEEMIADYKGKFEKVTEQIKFALVRNDFHKLKDLNATARKYKRQFVSWSKAYIAYKEVRKGAPILALPCGIEIPQEQINSVIEEVISKNEVKNSTIDVTVVESKKESTDSYKPMTNTYNTIIVPKEFSKEHFAKIQFKDNENIQNLVLLFIKSQQLNTRFSVQDISNLICTESSNRYDIMAVIKSFLSTLKRLGIISYASKTYIISQTFESLRSLERAVNNARIKYGTNVVDKICIYNIIKKELKVGESFCNSDINTRIKKLNTNKRILDIYVVMYIRSFLKLCVKTNHISYEANSLTYTVIKDLSDIETKIIIGDKERGLIYNSLYSLLHGKEYSFIMKDKSVNTIQLQNLVNSVKSFIKGNKEDISFIKDKNILRVVRTYLKSQNVRLYKCKVN
jgi:hypothetical protein